MSLRGSSEAIDWMSSEGSIAAPLVRVKPNSWMNAPATLSAQFSWTSQTVALSQLQASTLGSHAHFSGILTRSARGAGESPDASTVSLRANWEANVAAQDVNRVVPKDRFPALRKWQATGMVDSRGSMAGEWNADAFHLDGATRGGFKQGMLDAIGAVFSEALKMRGNINLDLARLDHPRLPAPVSNLKGGLVLSNQSLECRGITAKMLDSSVKMSGSLLGKPFFWSRGCSGDLKTEGRPRLVECGESRGCHGSSAEDVVQPRGAEGAVVC